MTYNGLKERILAFSSNRADLADVPKLLEKVNISLTQVCRDTIPLVLIKDVTSGRVIFRRIDNTNYICVPAPISDSLSLIELDANLLDALALHALAGIETGRAPAYMKMYWNIVDNHEQNIINTDMSINTTVLEDYVSGEEHFVIDTDDYNAAMHIYTTELDGVLDG